MAGMASKKSKTGTELWATRWPVDLAAKIRHVARDEGTTKSEALRVLVEAGLARRAPRSPRLDKLLQEMAVLRRQVEKVSKLVGKG